MTEYRKGKNLRVEVTQEDIDKAREVLGVPGCPVARANCCPIAQALKRTTGHEIVTVLTQEAYTPDAEYALSVNAKKFIEKFDNGRPVKPAGYWLTVL